ncbi:aspartic proteinase CDR1-like [Trifolium pratense]|uniref:aspartic proteinase CDR1-like n=1 Tax=Trifolium pratense TaxID=57577 RepID=UPI001E693BDF|nr:aspartic proteinase CDR1-like [Trifolium pratense]
MVFSKSFYTYLTIISLLFNLFHFSYIEAQNDGFTVNLIRKRPNNIITNGVQAPTKAYLGQYLMELYIGTPPIKILAEVDTGSDLVWVQCVPCPGCYEQINPMFDPLKSSTYNNISCDSPLCQQLYSHGCSPENICNYNYGYADNSVTNGLLAQETITLTSNTGKSVGVPKILFGCGHNDTGNFNDHEMGIIGLGNGPMSLISQLGPLSGGKKFSQCLVPFHTDISISSKMSFGKGSEVLGVDVVTTPLVSTEQDIQYSVTLLGISVEETFLPFDTNIAKGNIMIDSGTPPTYLPQALYDRVATEVRNRVSLKPILDDPSIGDQLCYRTQNNLNGPTLTFHFEGANVTLTPVQIFIPPKDGVFCLALAKNSGNDPSIYGNFAQSNYLIGFDLEKQVVSFKPTDCTKH